MGQKKMNKRRISHYTVFRTVVILLFVLIFASAIVVEIKTSFNDHTYIVTVTDKERINKSDDSYYLVYTKDESGNVHVFENEDIMVRMKFNSSDVQGQLEEGQTYVFTVVGYRIPIFSWYENIIEVEKYTETN
jgi:hypothetical protein